MKKAVDLKRKSYLYPAPVLIIGTVAQGRVNWSTVAYHGILDSQTILLAIESSHFTTKAIRENKRFSVNIPGAGDSVRTDYVGTRSGSACDKAEQFSHSLFDSVTPVIDEFALSYICQAEEFYEKNGKTYLVAKVTDVLAEEGLLREDGMIDIVKLDPLLFDWTGYYRLGGYVGRPFSK